MSGLWLSLAIRQLLRTLGQHRAILPMLVVALLTIPTAIVAVDRMAPHAHTVFHRLGTLAPERLVYGFALLMGVLLFPLQLQLLQELDASREIENLERFPLPRRALFHFKLIDQWVVFLPLVLLALGVTLAGGLFQLSESRREFHERTGGRGAATAPGEAPPVEVAKAKMAEELDRARRVGFFHAEAHLARELAAMEARGVSDYERRLAAYVDRDRTRTMLALAADRTIEATVSLAEKRPLSTQVAFALALWAEQFGLPVRAVGVPDEIGDLEPPSRRLWAELGLALPLGSRARAALAVCLVLVAVGVQLGLMFVVAFAIGLVPERAIKSRAVIALAVAVASLAAIIVILTAIPGMRRAAALGPYAPWALVVRTVSMVEHGAWGLALAPAALFLGQVFLLYELAGFAYRRNLLERRERINARIARLMSSKVPAGRVGGADRLTGPLVRLFGEPVGLYVAKDMRQITRPPINRLMIAMLVFPFGCLAAFVSIRLALVRPPNPFDGRALDYYGLASMLLAFYGLLTLFWIPCTQIFLFGYERWGLALVWFGPQSARDLYRGKAVAAGLVIAPAVALAFAGMALFIAVGGSPGWVRMLLVGGVFVAITAYVFGHVVASLGILFPYYLQTRFRHLAGGMGFMMQLSLVPAWVGTWIFGLVCAMYFGATGLAILGLAIAVWAGFARILSREAVEALDRIGREYGRTGDAPTPSASDVAVGA